MKMNTIHLQIRCSTICVVNLSVHQQNWSVEWKWLRNCMWL